MLSGALDHSPRNMGWLCFVLFACHRDTWDIALQPLAHSESRAVLTIGVFPQVDVSVIKSAMYFFSSGRKDKATAISKR